MIAHDDLNIPFCLKLIHERNIVEIHPKHGRVLQLGGRRCDGTAKTGDDGRDAENCELDEGEESAEGMWRRHNARPGAPIRA